MSGQKWTDDQLEAIQARNCNLLVAAAAGSGKTAVLVERIIRRITDNNDPVDVDRLLVVTFTKAAAAEMRDRINIALTRALDKEPGSEHLNRQLILLNKSYITTLHSFCLDIIRQYFYKVNLDPGFRVADDAEAALLKSDVLENLFEECYTEGTQEFLNLVDAYGGDKDDSYLQDMVLRLWEFSRSTPWPDHWLDSVIALYESNGMPLEKSDWGKVILDWIGITLEGCIEGIKQAFKLANAAGGPYAYAENLKDDLLLLDELFRASNSWERFFQTINSVQFSKLKSIRNQDLDETLKNRVKTIREDVKKTINAIKKEYFFRSQEELISDLQLVGPYVKTLVWLVKEFGERFEKEKIERSLVDFSDLEHYCLRILLDDSSAPDKIKPSSIAGQLKDHFAEIYVDEFQDINGVQESILSLLSGESEGNFNRFMVGDVKQSIYGFRLADPNLFREKYISFSSDKNSLERRIDLRKNFRSSIEVIDSVNFIFRQVMASRTGQSDYDQDAELVCGSDYPVDNVMTTVRGPVELNLIEKTIDQVDLPENSDDAESEDSEENDLADLDALQREARLVAARVKDMVSGNQNGSSGTSSITAVYDKNLGCMRPIRYRDIVVLLRSTRNAANIFIEEFRRIGIPAYAELGTGYFEAVEIETIMSLLKIIDNPRQDIPLAAVLRSPIVGLDAQEMAETRLRCTSGDFYEAVVQSANLAETATDLKLAKFLEKLEEWRTLARQGPLSDLIWRLYNETGFYTYVGGMPGGAQRQANLRSLYDRARQYENSTFRGLFRFLRFIDRFREEGNDLGSAGALGENEDVVRVISIHKSKGLEFPVVFVAGLGRQFNTSDLKQKTVFHKQLGIGLPFIDINNCLSYQTIAQKAIKIRLKMDMLAEEMRILYVAMTRAREKLILVGSVRGIDKFSQKWSQTVEHGDWPLPDSSLMTAKMYLDWICPAVVRHRDGHPFRKIAGIDQNTYNPVFNDNSRWNVRIYNPMDNAFYTVEKDSQDESLLDRLKELQPIDLEPKYTDIIDRYMEWRYPYSAIVGKAAKTTVTEMKRRFASEENTGESLFKFPAISYRRPSFITKKTGLSAAERGSALHLVMQHINFSSSDTEGKVIGQLNNLVKRELLTFEQAQSVDVSGIVDFVNSFLGQRVVKAGRVRREMPFIMGLPAQKVYPDLSAEFTEKVMIQGVIDCLIDEGDGFVLIDYKTDNLTEERIDEVRERYREQLDIYAMAVETILKRQVKEKYIYLFSLGREIKLD